MDESLKSVLSLPAARAAAEGDAVFSDDEKKLIDEWHRRLFGGGVRQCQCRSRYADALFEILNHLKKMGKSENKYSLKAGAVIQIGTEFYSRHNITDEVAAEYIGKFGASVLDKFDAYPAAEVKKMLSKKTVKKEA